MTTRSVEGPALAADDVIGAPLTEPLASGAEVIEVSPPALGCPGGVGNPLAPEIIPLDSLEAPSFGVSVTGIAPVSVVSVPDRTAVKVVGIDEAPSEVVGVSMPDSDADCCGTVDKDGKPEVVKTVSSVDDDDPLPAGTFTCEFVVGVPFSIVSSGGNVDSLSAGTLAGVVVEKPVSVMSSVDDVKSLPIGAPAGMVVGTPVSAVSSVDMKDPLPAGTPAGVVVGMPVSVARGVDVEDPLSAGDPPGAVSSDEDVSALPLGTMTGEFPGVDSGDDDGADPLPVGTFALEAIAELLSVVSGGDNVDALTTGTPTGVFVDVAMPVVSRTEDGDCPNGGLAGEEEIEPMEPLTEVTTVPFTELVSGFGAKILMVGNSVPTGEDPEISSFEDGVGDVSLEVI